MSLHLTPTALAKAKALAVVAAALSAGGVGGVVALSQVADTSTTAVTVASDATPSPTESPTATPTVSPSDSPSATDAAVAAATPTSTAYVLPSCPADVKNHGAYVSSVAKSAPKGKGGEHGSWVSQAAHSDCGKPTPGASESADAQDSPDAQHSPETESPKPPKTTHGSSDKHSVHGPGGHKHGG